MLQVEVRTKRTVPITLLALAHTVSSLVHHIPNATKQTKHDTCNYKQNTIYMAMKVCPKLHILSRILTHKYHLSSGNYN